MISVIWFKSVKKLKKYEANSESSELKKYTFRVINSKNSESE